MKFPTVCMGTLALTGALSVTQNDVRGLCQFRTVYLHLQQHKKVMCGRCCRLPFHIFWGIIKNISNVINHTEIRFTQRGVVDGHTKVFVDLTLCGGHLCNISILCVYASENAIDNIRIHMWHFQIVKIPEYSALLSFYDIIYHIQAVFVSPISHII